MHTFRGWVPTITGKLSFSQVGSDSQNKQDDTVVNHLGEGRELFAIQNRVSRDGPLPIRLQFLLNRNPKQIFLIKASVVSGATMSGRFGKNDLPIWVTDEQGTLSGKIFIYSCPIPFRKREHKDLPGWKRVKALRQEIVLSSGFKSRELQFLKKTNIEDIITACDPAETFYCFDFTISRSGQCTLIANNIGVFPQASRKESLARQAFFCLRDLIHKHYHHGKSDHELIGMCYNLFPSTGYDDLTWRRETLYGLTRMALKNRRAGKIKDNKNALGVLAYARSFQHHFLNWTYPSQADEKSQPPVTQKNLNFSAYDFDAFNASLKADISVHEWSRSSFIGIGAFTVSLLAIFLSAMMSAHIVMLSMKAEEPVSEGFKSFLRDFPLQHPIAFTILPPLVLGAFALAWVKEVKPPHINRLIHRLVNALLHDINKLIVNTISFASSGLIAWSIVLVILVACIQYLFWAVIFWDPFNQ